MTSVRQAFVNNVFEVRVDAEKLLKLTRRPEPRGAADIGTWFDVLEISNFLSLLFFLFLFSDPFTDFRPVSFVAVATNIGMICFETNLINDIVPREAIKVYLFIIAEVCLYSLFAFV